MHEYADKTGGYANTDDSELDDIGYNFIADSENLRSL